MAFSSLGNKDVEISSKHGSTKRVRNAAIFVAIVALFTIADQVSKVIFNAYTPGQVITELIPNVLGLKLIHNTGGAWGIFGDMTYALAILSVVICAIIVVYLFVMAPSSSVLMTVGLSLVFAGGLGNLIDRITNGYVIDFIQPLFIDFPVFNVADIGVTCGVITALIALMLEMRDDKLEDGAH